MPPKKNNTDLSQKVVKKRIRKVKLIKPPLKTPLNIELQVSNLYSETPTFTKKIDITNAVAHAQLIKPKNVPLKPIPSSEVKSPEVIKKNTPAKRKNKITPKIYLEKSDDITLAKKVTENKATKDDESVLENKPKRIKKITTMISESIASDSRSKSPEKSNDITSARKVMENKTTKDDESVLENKPKRIKKITTMISESIASDSPSKSPAKRKLSKPIPSEKSEPQATEPKILKPRPKSKTIPQIKKKPLADLIPETNEAVKIESKVKNGGKKGQQKVLSDFFHQPEQEPGDGTRDDKPEEVHKTPAKKVYKRKPIPKKAVAEKKESKIAELKPPTKVTRGKPRTKFVSERPDDNNSTVKPDDNNSTVTTRGRMTRGKVLSANEINTAATKFQDSLVAARVITRSNSGNSSKSNLSWTRDISTASDTTTTTCITVSSNDIVRFDNKLPIVQMENTLNLMRNMQTKEIKKADMDKDINISVLEGEESTSDSTSSDSSSESETDVSIGYLGPNLSTSSLSPVSPKSDIATNNIELICIEINKLKSSLKNFQSEISKCIEWDDDESTFSAVLETMNLERDILRDCKRYQSHLDSVHCIPSPEKACQDDTRKYKDNSGSDPSIPDQMDRHQTSRKSENEKSRPSSISSKDREKIPLKLNVPSVTQVLTCPVKVKSVTGSSESFTSDNYNYVSFDKTYDDEDALSLFAESITGIESSRRDSIASISNASAHDIYIPQPKTRPWLPEKYVYKPTRIQEIPVKTIEPKMIKIQNADSSSIYKEMDIKKTAVDLLEDTNKLSSLAQESVKIPQQLSNKRLFTYYQAIPAVKSSLYRGHCFFYLSTICINKVCRFPHTDIDRNLVKCRLTLLHEDNLIQEYLLTCAFVGLRQKFILLFVEECKRRKSTRILMEMAIDIGLRIIEREDESLIINVLETTLLHLNTISFDACDDQLKFEYNNRMLCDALLSCMSDSQNFAQFKQAFVKLANFMWEMKRPVDIEVAGKILERVCILPGEENLARGMLTLMRNTDPSIFENSMTKSFEVQLSNIESDVFEAYLLSKKLVIEAQLQNCLEQSDECDNSHTPPDTTTLDNLKKVQMAPPTTFKCTINTDAIPGSEAIRDLFKSPTNPVPKLRYNIIPKEPVWRTGRYPLRHQRGNLQARGLPTRAQTPIQGRGRMPSGRTVFRTQTNFKNGANF